MQIAILTVSSLGLVVGVMNLAILAKTAKELQAAKTEVDAVKTKVANNAKVVKEALRGLEL